MTSGKAYTCLSLASERGYHDIVSALLAHPTMDMKCPIHAKCLVAASANGHHEVARLLLSHPDVDVNLGELESGFTPLCAACWEGHIEVVRILLCAPNIDVNKKIANLVEGINLECSPLKVAMLKENSDIALLLTQAGAC